MLKKCKLRMWEDNPTIDIEDGTTIPYEKIGWIACQYGGYPEDVFYEKMSKDFSFNKTLSFNFLNISLSSFL
jgi:hypothetical protein